MKAAAALALALLVASPCVGQPRVETGFLDRTVDISGQRYRFQIYVPAEYTSTKTWPVILDLHGNGAQGTDGMFQTTGRSATPIRAERDRYPVLVVFPQAQPGTRWLDPLMQDMAIAELDQTMREFNIDSARVYLTGFSMGGTGAYAFAARWPNRFAALVVVAGRVGPSASSQTAQGEARPAGDQAGASADGERAAPSVGQEEAFEIAAGKIKHLPIWIFHGAADETVPVDQSRKMSAALKALGSRVRYTEYAGTNHLGAWGRAYADPQMAAWLLAQRRPAQAPE